MIPMNNPIKTQLQKGIAILVGSFTILIITTLMVFFAAREGLFDLRISANDVRYKEAFAIAEAGLDFTIQKFEDQFRTNFTGPASWSTIISNSQVATGTEIDGTVAEAGEPSFGVSIIDTGALINGMTVFHFQSTGVSADGTGKIKVNREITVKQILGGSSPAVSILLSGTMGTGGNFNIVANPNGAGNGIPVSIWTNDEVTMTGSSATCQKQYFDGNNAQCSNSSGNSELLSEGDGTTISSYNPAFPDVLPNDPHFHHDIFRYIFGVARNDWEAIYSMANSNHQVASSCSGLNTTSGQKFRLWWITGNCYMGSNQVVGSENDPVILVIDDHKLDMRGGARIYGVPYLFDNPGNNATPGSDFHGNPAIYGSFVSDIGGNAMQGSYSVVYEPTLLGNLTSPNKSSNYGIALFN